MNQAYRHLIGHVTDWHFNWNPFRPKICLGGTVRIGEWASVEYFDEDGNIKKLDMTPEQVRVKQSMGLIY